MLRIKGIICGYCTYALHVHVWMPLLRAAKTISIRHTRSRANEQTKAQRHDDAGRYIQCAAATVAVATAVALARATVAAAAMADWL